MTQDERESAEWDLDQTLCWISTGDAEVAKGGDWLRLFLEGEADEPPPWRIIRGREAAINLLKNLLADGELVAFERAPDRKLVECAPMAFAQMPVHFGSHDNCYFDGGFMVHHRPVFKRKQVIAAVPPDQPASNVETEALATKPNKEIAPLTKADAKAEWDALLAARLRGEAELGDEKSDVKNFVSRYPTLDRNTFLSWRRGVVPVGRPKKATSGK